MKKCRSENKIYKTNGKNFGGIDVMAVETAAPGWSPTPGVPSPPGRGPVPARGLLGAGPRSGR